MTPQAQAMLDKYRVRIDEVVKQKQAIEQHQASRERGGEDLDWMRLDEGESAMLRVMPLPGGKFSKEVHRYRNLGDKKFVSPRSHSGIDDPYYLVQSYLRDTCRYWREQFANRFSKESAAYTASEEYTKQVWTETSKLRESVEHYMAVLHYTSYNPQLVPLEVDLKTFTGPRLFKVSETTYLKFLGIVCSPMYSNPPIFDFENGRRMFFKRTGTGLDTVYDVIPDPVTTPFPKTSSGDIDVALLESIPDLDALFKPASLSDMNSNLHANGFIKLSEILNEQLANIWMRFDSTTPPPIPSAGFQVPVVTMGSQQTPQPAPTPQYAPQPAPTPQYAPQPAPAALPATMTQPAPFVAPAPAEPQAPAPAVANFMADLKEKLAKARAAAGTK